MMNDSHKPYINYMDANGKYFTVENVDSSYMTEEELDDYSCAWDGVLNDIKKALDRIVELWVGHANFQWKTLTPEHLTDLNADCKHIKRDIKVFLNEVDEVLGLRSDAYGYTAGDYANEIHALDFELELMQVIRKSYELSSGESQGIDGIVDLAWYKEKYAGTAQERLLKPITVKPWVCPPVPKLVIPERPNVVLQVLSVDDGAPRCSVGFDDVFCNKPIGVGILFGNDDVRVGDRVIIKTSGWDGIGYYLDNPEYDGLAEPECPISDMSEVMDARYDFDVEKEQELLEETWERNWKESNFIVKTYEEILYSDRTTMYDFDVPDKPEYEYEYEQEYESEEYEFEYKYEPSPECSYYYPRYIR